MTAASLARRPRAPNKGRAEALAGYLFIAVPMALFLVLNVGSIVYALFISVWKWNLRSGPVEFTGLRNYGTALSDPIFQTAIRNTLYYAVVWVPLTMALGLFLAVIVNQKIHGQTFFRAAFYFPAIASSAAITTLWIFIMAPDGIFNQVRGMVGLNPLFSLLGFTANQNWIGDQGTAMNTIILLNAWTTSGTFMLFYLASLQSISREVYEAAAIDGAGAWQTFRRITFPLLKPGHYFVATVAVIGALQLFDQALIGGGVDGAPNNALMTMVLYLYNAAFKQFNFSYAAAIGIILFVVIFTATLVQRRLFGQAPAW
ncbi:MAG TPA: sugar ABC transporter permease [Candidatus Limnocylindrales bacterium]|jgi:multiple sugar transport system permease protein